MISAPRRHETPGRRRCRLPRWAWGCAVVAVALLAGAAAVWWGQRSLIYFPGSETPGLESAPAGSQEVSLVSEDEVELTAWFVKPDPEADRDQAVLYMPGNGGDRSARAGIAAELSARGFGVLLLDYRGYGGNPGSPSEEGIAHDARAAVAAVRELGYTQESIIYFGESLGTAVAARLHRDVPPAALVPRSPFTDLAALGEEHYGGLPVGWFLRDGFPVAEHVSGTDVPVTVIYGSRDDVVPVEQSRHVAAAAGEQLVEEVEFSAAGHNDPVMFGPEVAGAVERLAESLQSADDM